MVLKWEKMFYNAQYSTSFVFKKGICFACKTNRLTRFDPIRVPNTEPNVKFFSNKFFQSNNLLKLTSSTLCFTDFPASSEHSIRVSALCWSKRKKSKQNLKFYPLDGNPAGQTF